MTQIEDVHSPGTHSDADSASRPDDVSYIRLENLRKTFGDGSIVACEDIDLDIAHDEFVVLLGPSGCGKTTTLRSIAGLEDPDSGRILIDGEDVVPLEPKDRDLAFVFQNITLYPHMTVERNMRFGLDMKTDLDEDEKERRVGEAAEILGIEELLDRKPKELSGGQRQRVSLGRAMVMEPAAFLLDEPFSALDANLRDTMRVEVKKLQRRLETAMIFVTHDQEEAMTLGDKIVILEGGHIQQVGSAYDIYNEPRNRFVAEFIGSPSTNMIDCTVEETDGTLLLTNETFSVTLTPDQAERTDIADGDGVTLGIRPEYLSIDDSDPLFEAEITVVEPHGNNDAVYLDVDGREFTAVTPQGEITTETGRIPVSFDRGEIWVFDGGGERLL